MVKGISRRVIVVDSPDKRFFEQAIFIVRNDVLERDGVTSRQVLDEACRVASGYARNHTYSAKRFPKFPAPVWALFGGGITCALWLVFTMVI